MNNKVVVITGGTAGIGKATAVLFADEGADVIITGRNSEAGERISIESEYSKGSIDFFKCDVSKTNDVKELAQFVENKYRRVDVLFNNAGIMPESKEIERIPEDEWKHTFEVNLDGMFYVIRELKDYIFRCKGCIINNASIAGMQSYIAGRSYAYSASKSAVIQFTRQMALNYAENGVRVNAIAPGIINTNILGDRDRDEYAKRVPLGYLAEPKAVADTVFFLASDAASYITGTVIPIDGGVSLR